MDAIDKRLRDLGYDNLWTWLNAHPALHWVEIGKELGFVPIVVATGSRWSSTTWYGSKPGNHEHPNAVPRL